VCVKGKKYGGGEFQGQTCVGEYQGTITEPVTRILLSLLLCVNAAPNNISGLWLFFKALPLVGSLLLKDSPVLLWCDISNLTLLEQTRFRLEWYDSRQ
jgi:hypothetical protein